MILFGVIWVCMKDNYSHTVLIVSWHFICGWLFLEYFTYNLKLNLVSLELAYVARSELVVY